MKFIPRSLKTSCIITLVRNYRYINHTILPDEVSTEIIEAIRNPKYGEQKVRICYFEAPTTHHRDILEYLYQHDPKNPILHYYDKNTPPYFHYHYIRPNYNIHDDGLIHDPVHDVVIAINYTHLVTHEATFCYLEEELPTPLLDQLKSKYKIVSYPVYISSLTFALY